MEELYEISDLQESNWSIAGSFFLPDVAPLQLFSVEELVTSLEWAVSSNENIDFMET